MPACWLTTWPSTGTCSGPDRRAEDRARSCRWHLILPVGKVTLLAAGSARRTGWSWPASLLEVARSSRRGLPRDGEAGELSDGAVTQSGRDAPDQTADEATAAPEIGPATGQSGQLATNRSRVLKLAARSDAAGGGPTGISGSAVTPFTLLRHSHRPNEREDNEGRPASAALPFDDAGVGAARQGDPSSWEAAYLAYGRALMGYLMVRLDNREDAAEALSETFTRAIDKVAAFRGDAYAFRAWLFSIARNVSTDQHRQRARLVVVPDQVESADRAQPSGEDLAITHEDVTLLRKGFARLPKTDQEVLWLRVCSGLSASEVGHVMGKKAGAVRMQQLRALGALRGQVRL